jgi:hypothetical protein
MQRHLARDVVDYDGRATKDIRRIFFWATCDVTTAQRTPGKCVSKRLSPLFCIALSRGSYIIAAKDRLEVGQGLAAVQGD